MNQKISAMSFSPAAWVAGVICCCLLSCQPASEIGAFAGKKPFVDVTAYFEAEIDKLNAANPPLKKTVTYNGAVETHETRENDFAKELKLFAEADINRPAWTDKYRVDSLIVAGEKKQVTYTALDSSLNIKTIVINYEHGDIAQVDIRKRQQNLAGRSQQYLHYEPGKGFAINSFQETILTKPKELTIEVSFQ